jgi:hypothetical protein
MKEVAGRKVSLANQKSIERGVSSFVLSNDSALNKLDSLVYATAADRPEGGAYGFDFEDAQTLYRGPTDATDEATREKNSGLSESLLSALAVYRLSDAEAAALRRLGLRYVAQFTAYATDYPSMKYTSGTKNANADGSIPTAANGLDPLLSCCILRTVTNGMAVAAVTPINNMGRLIYQDCGAQLALTNSSYGNFMTDVVYDKATAKREVENAGGPLLAFGLGDGASVVGNPNTGLDSAPFATFLPRRYYTRYVLLFRLRRAGAGSVSTIIPEFAGVLDCEGNTVRAAQHIIKDL